MEFSDDDDLKKTDLRYPQLFTPCFRLSWAVWCQNRTALCVFPLPAASAEKENTMSWNNALERKKFERRWSQEEKAYREAGMTEEQILSIRELEEEQYRSNRRYQMHTLEFEVNEFDEDDSDESDNALFYKNLEAFSVEMPSITDNSRFGWIQEIENTDLVNKLNQLSKADLELITMIAFDELSQSEIAKKMNCNQSVISRKMTRIKNFLSSMS